MKEEEEEHKTNWRHSAARCAGIEEGEENLSIFCCVAYEKVGRKGMEEKRRRKEEQDEKEVNKGDVASLGCGTQVLHTPRGRRAHAALL